MGLYSAALTLFSVSGPVDLTGFVDAKAKHGIRFTTSQGTNGQIVYTFTGNYISLDGNPAIAFTGLPAGFEFLSIGFNNSESGAFTTAVGIVSGDLNGTTQSIVTWGVHGPVTTNSGTSGAAQNIIPTNLGAFKVIDMLSSFQIQLNDFNTSSPSASEFCWGYDNLKGTGSYDIYASITPASSTVVSHLKVTLTAPSKLDLLQEVRIYDNSGNFLGDAVISNQSATSIDITMPNFASYSGPGTAVGVEFGGRTYILQPLVIILGDPSGLYVIVPNKTNDTLYLDHTTLTQDVAIPNPFAKTGFVE